MQELIRVCSRKHLALSEHISLMVASQQKEKQATSTAWSGDQRKDAQDALRSTSNKKYKRPKNSRHCNTVFFTTHQEERKQTRRENKGRVHAAYVLVSDNAVVIQMLLIYLSIMLSN